MEAEGAYCLGCRAEFRLTMRPEGCPDRLDHQCDTCQEALSYICSVVERRAQQAGGHLPIENKRWTDYACCRGCDTHVKISTYTGAASPWWERADGGCFREAVAALFGELPTSPIYATIPNGATKEDVERTCDQFGLQLHLGWVEVPLGQPVIVLYISGPDHGHAVCTRDLRRFRHNNVFAVIT
jgi:hypothetical protein